MNGPSEKDDGVITVLMQRLETQRLPRVLALKEKVDNGEVLSEYDLTFLSKVFQDASQVKSLFDRHPEYQDLAARLVHLYREITDKALENEQRNKP